VLNRQAYVVQHSSHRELAVLLYLSLLHNLSCSDGQYVLIIRMRTLAAHYAGGRSRSILALFLYLPSERRERVFQQRTFIRT
jgi:hypothetical protein